jgi:hypothetical protein
MLTVSASRRGFSLSVSNRYFSITNLRRVLYVVCFLLGNSPAYKDGTECSETSAYKIQTPGNYPEKKTQHNRYFYKFHTAVRDQ